MSTDDIVFEGDVAYRQPQRACRPDRDRRFTCIAYEVPGPDDLPIFLDRRPADAIERHALRDTGVELGGILLGKECIDEQTGRPFVWITQALEAKHYENTQASFTYTHDSWEEITRERDRAHPDLDIVGWYHTHPDFGIFLSSHDLFIHHNFFPQPLQVAYVVDPVRQTRGFFQWRDGQMEQVGGYFLVAGRGDRVALARLVNDLENLPQAEGGGGGLSPRLEAELIAMLTRPQQPMMAASQAQTATLFAMLGALVGVLGVAAWLWLQSLQQGLQTLGDEMKAQTKALAVKDTLTALATESERVRAKEAALDALLREVRVGGTSESFAASYARAVQDRDEARNRLAQKVAATNAVEEKIAQVAARNQTLSHENAALLKQRDSIEAEAKKEREKIAASEKALQAKVETMERIQKETGSGLLAKKYGYAWYAAVTGWVVSLGLALGLLASQGRGVVAEAAAEEPPHTIA